MIRCKLQTHRIVNCASIYNIRVFILLDLWCSRIQYDILSISIILFAFGGFLSFTFRCYLNYTQTINENISILIEVFDIMSQNTLQLRLDKCSFLQTKIQYLGYEISNKGITPNPDNVNAIHNFPIPKNKKEVHSFLGLASYFRRFVKYFSIIAKPLYDLFKTLFLRKINC